MVGSGIVKQSRTMKHAIMEARRHLALNWEASASLHFGAAGNR